jgi:hypothetical protein
MLDRLKIGLADIPPALVTGPVEARITAHFHRRARAGGRNRGGGAGRASLSTAWG